MQRRTVLLSLSLLSLSLLPLSLLPGLATAQADYPKAGAGIRYVVPFPPDGPTDGMARAVGRQLGERKKTTVVIDNKPGNGGQIGAAEVAEVAKAQGDGQTLLAITLTHAANATQFKGKAPFDFAKDLKPVALLAGRPMLVVVPAASPIKDFKDLVARAKGGKLNAGSSGNGTPPHLALALFNELHKTDIQHVPYKGGAPSMVDRIGGQLDVIFSNMPESIAHVKSGKLRALAIASTARHPLLPEVPITAEAGAPQLAVENWTAVMVPGSTPDAVVAKLGAEVVKTMQAPDIEERARTQGTRVDARGPQPFAAFLKEEVDRWGRTIAAAKITAA